MSLLITARLPASLPAYQPASLPASQPACQPASLPTCLPAFPAACLPACLPVRPPFCLCCCPLYVYLPSGFSFGHYSSWPRSRFLFPVDIAFLSV
jgi:hypothetical protein